MPGPQTQTDALKWIQEAMPAGRYVVSVHFQDRLRERKLDMEDVFVAIEKASGCLPYTKEPPRHDGTCWRVAGPNVDEDRTVAVGIEAFMDKQRRRCVLCTIFRPGED